MRRRLQNGLLVGGFRAGGSQAFAKLFDLHGGGCYAAFEQVGLSSFTGLIPREGPGFRRIPLPKRENDWQVF